MKSVVAVGLLASMFASVAANADEGRVRDLVPIAPRADRVATYSNEAGVPIAATKASGKQHGIEAKGGVAQTKAFRAGTPQQSLRAGDFTVAEVGSTLLTDRDNDGQFSEFRIRFDVDTVFVTADVYAALYIRRVGDRDWILYHTTNDFEVDGSSDNDDYFVTTKLDDGFPAGQYDVLIDIYESGFSGVVATVGPFDTGALADLPLEETGLDVPIQLSGFAINDVSTTLITDTDRDGNYSKFRIAFDPDASVQGSYVYAVIYLRPQGGDWIKEHESDDFMVDASGTADSYGFTAEWISGYPTALYDVQIDLHDASTGLLVASAGSERSELSRVPLEDQSRDKVANDPLPPPNGGDVSSRERGGGAMTWPFVLGLGLLALVRRFGSPSSRAR
jgi:hypothetical protein